MADTYDVLIIGSGPGGYVTAIRAAQLGLKTAVVEKAHLGGICLNWGCIPTKALLRSAEVYDHFKHAKDYGLAAKDFSFDIAKVVERSRGVSKQLNGGVGMLLKKNKVDVIWGTAKITAPGKVDVKDAPDAPKGAKGGGSYAAKNIIVATGARPRALPGLEPDKENIWTYFEAMVPKELPKKLLVVGSGAIGIEFASFFNSMGSEVTVVEVMDQILPVEDVEIAKLARKQLEKQGLKIMTSAKVAKIEKGRTQKVSVEANGKTETIEVDKVISAVGVVGNIEGLGLEELGVKTERGCVVIDDFGATNVKGVYAIGDVAGPPMLAHKAEHEGVICVEAIAGKKPHPMDKGKIPGCTYCHPQVASVGLTEAKAKAAGREVKVGRFPFIGNGKAIALGAPDGLVKTVFDAKTGELLGAHMVGAEVTELIQGFVVAMNLETTEEELIHAVFPHPTLSEMMHESVLDAYGRAIHI
ncbi:dihydrolipoyl dehydrogenase [Acuticoccus sp. I52.16.1]|uniref:dihydrolipoyl dehydrogenase n=1 Tax=Acuticoccus sp. I52.16.1 TaxID=2928472 RepID=UPI001FD5AADC|nr:dihydrolipoyl dehydrogenase [Acuticoccus sp. I52.16.1]UOM35292.1 dihydrolipoyl dehydrogenase [Acuticoccus sp. I52.16.1]